jgi:hypothetical protein
MEILDGKGEVRFRQLPRNQTAQNYLGGNSLFSVAVIDIPPQAKAGDYTVRITIEDRATKGKATLSRKGKVLPPAFGLIRVNTSADAEGHTPCPPVGIPGESLYINFLVAGFERDKDTRQPRLAATMRILDEAGKPTTGKPLEHTLESGVADKLPSVPMQFGLTLNRTGRFTVELTVEDRLAGRQARATFPIRVVAVD